MSDSRPILDHLVDVGLRVVDEGGVAAVTIRRLASEATYAPSTVSYHVGSIEAFRDRLWTRMSADIVATFFDQRPPGVEFHDHVSGLLLAWADRYPERCDFFVRHQPAPEICWQMLPLMSPSIRDAFDRAGSAAFLQHVNRMLQTSVQFATSLPDDRRQASLTADIAHIGVAFHRMLAELEG